ncbi:hypothetical protein CC80DRAFT_101010 [Byssothecium circinans]|uniref:Uncharacterized protein n=1 Tax=Byssothecium circinans TaxID=147558 RepID=A0A6A5UG69_9PLEO|nr:hypothetical protein CC80DRAFT_101010 [Byssothecium circinans]
MQAVGSRALNFIRFRTVWRFAMGSLARCSRSMRACDHTTRSLDSVSTPNGMFTWCQRQQVDRSMLFSSTTTYVFVQASPGKAESWHLHEVRKGGAGSRRAGEGWTQSRNPEKPRGYLSQEQGERPFIYTATCKKHKRPATRPTAPCVSR